MGVVDEDTIEYALEVNTIPPHSSRKNAMQKQNCLNTLINFGVIESSGGASGFIVTKLWCWLVPVRKDHFFYATAVKVLQRQMNLYYIRVFVLRVIRKSRT